MYPRADTMDSLFLNSAQKQIDQCMAYVYTYIYHKFRPNVEKYSIHWASGILIYQTDPTSVHLTKPFPAMASWNRHEPQQQARGFLRRADGIHYP